MGFARDLSGRILAAAFLLLAAPLHAAPPIVTISYPAPGASFLADTPIWFGGAAYSGVTGQLPPAALSWSSDRDGAFGMGNSFSHSGLTTGAHVITLSAAEGQLETGIAQVRILIWNPHDLPLPRVTIQAPHEGATVEAGSPVPCQGAAFDFRGFAIDAGSLTWASDRDGPLGTGDSLTATFAATGSHRITLGTVDTLGRTNAAQISIEVTPPAAATPLAVAIVSPAAESPPRYATVPMVLAATVSGGSPASPPQVSMTWASNRSGNLGTGASIEVTLVETGLHSSPARLATVPARPPSPLAASWCSTPRSSRRPP